MQYGTLARVALASAIFKLLLDIIQEICKLASRFIQAGPTPQTAWDFERELAQLLREAGRRVLEHVYNRIEPELPQNAPHYLESEAGRYRRLSAKTANPHVATLFGKIKLCRLGYRFVHREAGERTLFPLEMALGLIKNATPALAEVAARSMALAGATQGTVLARLWEEHGVRWGVETLRAVTAELEARMSPLRRAAQVEQVRQWLDWAWKSPGTQHPTLSVGRDGITLATRPHGFFEVATVSTVTVYDRQGQRVGSVYLGFVPEAGQQTMTDELTALLLAILEAWPGRLPRLVYLTDAGEQECSYFCRVLRRLRHPRTGKRLAWTRILDYYHASRRLTEMAEALFGSHSREAASWARRMRKLLKQRNGVFRVLHSAAAIGARRSMTSCQRKQYQRAYNYLRRRSRYLRYHEYRQAQLPIGSGVTEAAAKTLFTQRLKLSGMRWSKAGAQVILNLRAIFLSGVWSPLYRTMLSSMSNRAAPTPVLSHLSATPKAA